MNEVLAVLVLYKCKLEDSETFNSLAASLNRAGKSLDILVYDNSPVKHYSQSKFCIDNFYVYYISDTSNPGVSKAYNIGAALAKEKNKKWLLLLDQDTVFPLDAIKKYNDHQLKESVICAPILKSEYGVISPCRYKWGHGKALKHYVPGMNNFSNKSLLNSGLLVPLELFNAIGGYDERIPLDFSDHDFVERAIKITSVFFLSEIVCKHSLSAVDIDKNRVLFRFRSYLKGAKVCCMKGKSWGFRISVMLRTLKLSVKYKSFDFLKMYWDLIKN